MFASSLTGLNFIHANADNLFSPRHMPSFIRYRLPSLTSSTTANRLGLRQVCAARPPAAVIDFTKSINGLHKHSVNRIPLMSFAISTVSQRIYGIFSWLSFVSIMVPTICLLTITAGQRNRRVIVKKAAKLIFFVNCVTPRVSGHADLPTCRLNGASLSRITQVILMASS
jgi:hypothetical protein